MTSDGVAADTGWRAIAISTMFCEFGHEAVARLLPAGVMKRELERRQAERKSAAAASTLPTHRNGADERPTDHNGGER